MTADLYCTRADVNARLPPGSVTSTGTIAASTSAGTNAITFDGHGLETGDPVTVRAVSGGSLSAPLVADVTYYVRRLSNSAFELAETLGGPAIDITTTATDMMVIREPNYDTHIEFYSRWCDAFLPAHIVPLEEPIHPLVKGLVADLVAKRMLNIAGQDSAVLTQTELASKAQMERFAKGLSLRGADATESANSAVTSTSITVADPRGWHGSTGSGYLP